MKKDMYREFFEQSADAFLIMGGDKCVDCNASAVKMLRYKNKQDLLDKHPAQLSPERQPDGRLSSEKADEMMAISIERGSHFYEWELLRADGEVIPVEVSLTAVTKDNKNTLYVVWRDITEQKKAETEKLETEKKFKAIFNHRFQLTGLLAADATLLVANQTACDMVNVDSKELEGKYFWELPHWSHSKALQLKVRDAVHSVQKGNVVSFETTHVDSKGDVHFIDFSLTPVRNEKGEIIFIVPEGHDITAKRQSENRLIESERNYREIYNSSSDAIIIHDAETGKIVDVNQTMLEMFGYTYPEALQLEIGDISSGELQFAQKEAVEYVRKAVTEGPQLFEWFAGHKNGAGFWIEVSLRNTTIGGKGRVLAVVRDITQRKKIDSELRLVKHSIEHSAYPFLWVQEDARLFYVNEASCRSLGYTHEELCSLRVSDIDPNHPIETWPAFWEKLKSEKNLVFESSHLTKSGEVFPVEITANHLEFEGQEHVFAYVKDISDRLRYENEQKQLQAKLQQAQKMEAIGTLAGGIAHDFNNILSAIFGHTELARIHADNAEKLHNDLDKVFQGASRAKDLVKQILTFCRKSDQELQPIPIQPVVKEALKLLRSSIPTTIEIKQDIDQACEAVLADPTHIHQIVMNLCTNAYHAMRESGGMLTISLQPLELTSDALIQEIVLQSGSYLKLMISDTGCGMSKIDQERIYEPYFTTKEKGEGTGLGLAVVHGIVESMKGIISVYSELGKGTVFQIFLPVIKSKNAVAQKKDAAPAPTGNERILLVDDDKALVPMYKEILEHLGYTVSAFTSSAVALDIFKRMPNNFDLVITDMTMPGMTGADLTRQMLAVRPDLPVILLTGFSELIDAGKAKDFGIRSYVMKPVIKNDIAITIRKVLDGSPFEVSPHSGD